MSELKMKPRLRAEELTGMISLPRDKVVSSENLNRCCFAPMNRNSVLDGLRSNLLSSSRRVCQRKYWRVFQVKKLNLKK